MPRFHSDPATAKDVVEPGSALSCRRDVKLRYSIEHSLTQLCDKHEYITVMTDYSYNLNVHHRTAAQWLFVSETS